MFRLDESLALRNFDALVKQGEIAWSPSEPVYRTVDNIQLEFRLCPQLLPATSPSPPPRRQNVATAPSPPTRIDGDVLSPPSSLFTISAVGPNHTLTLPRTAVHRPQYLLLTNDWRESQNVHLNASDLAAAWTLLHGTQTPVFVTYNCGARSGSSSSHKHLQVFPRPGRGEDQANIKGLELFPDRLSEAQARASIPYQYFLHRFSQPLPPFSELDDLGHELMSFYFKLLVSASDALEHAQPKALSISQFTDPFEFPHNVVITPEWMLVIPRREGHVGGAIATAAGMLGMVWVRAREEVSEWERRGAKELLSVFGVPA